MRGLEGELVLSLSIEPVFLLNFAVDLAWLWATGALAGMAVHRNRIILAAVMGASGAVWAYFPSGRWLAGWGMLPGSLILLAVAYGPRRLRDWMRLVAYLLLTGAAMAGSVLLLGARVAGPAGAAVGVLPAPAGTAAAAGILLCLVGIRRLWDAARERARLQSGLCGLRVTQDGRSVEVVALLDTGNRLQDPLTGIPVVVLEASALAGVLPTPVLAAVAAGWQGMDGLPEDWKRRLRLVPFRSVGRPDGFLLAFAPDQLAVRASTGEEWITISALVGLAPHPLHQEGAYRALLPPTLLQRAAEVPGKTGEGETG